MIFRLFKFIRNTNIIKFPINLTIRYKQMSQNKCIISVRADARRPLWNEIRFCERAMALSKAFLSVIIADHSDLYEGV
jgi:hypothetical protein